MSKKPILLWLRQDLRLEDNPALNAAAAYGHPILPLFLWTPEEEKPWIPGAACQWWLHQSLKKLGKEFQNRGGTLIIREGLAALTLLEQLIEATQAETVFWNRRYEPNIIARDKKIKATLQEKGIIAKSFNANLLWEPWEIFQNSKKPYQVFTPYWKKILSLHEPAAPQARPKTLDFYSKPIASLALEDLSLEPKIPWGEKFKDYWNPGEIGAQEKLAEFLESAITSYQNDRDFPSIQGTSQLSPHLHFGEISPRQIWHGLQKKIRESASPLLQKNALFYLRELGWREFAHHLLFHFPHTSEKPLRPQFEKFPWKKNQKFLQALQCGQTGYPIVDAGMRELWHCGWMHNRVRMIVASFLIKDLKISWNEGAAWFWDTLVDADLANNSMGWQWTAGCGADASPYFRVFNPLLQSKKFDPRGEYLRHWLPELKDLPSAWIHAPDQAPEEVLRQAKVILGKTYPRPIVDHAQARMEALELYKNFSAKSKI